MKNQAPKIQAINMFDQDHNFSIISHNANGKQYSRKNVIENHIQIRYDETKSIYKISFGAWADLKDNNTMDLGVFEDDPTKLYISIDSSESGKSLSKSIKSYSTNYKDFVKKALNHLGVEYGPEQIVSEFVPVKLSEKEDFGYIFLIDKEAYLASKRPKSMLKAFGLKKAV